MASATSGTVNAAATDEPASRGPLRSIGSPASAAEPRSVAGSFDRADEIGHRDALRIEANVGLLRRVVDRRLHSVELVELALDAIRARRARHAVEGEIDACTLGSLPSRSCRLVAGLDDRATQRDVVELAAADDHDLRVEIDGDVLDAVDLGQLLANRLHAVRRSGSQARCT